MLQVRRCFVFNAHVAYTYFAEVRYRLGETVTYLHLYSTVRYSIKEQSVGMRQGDCGAMGVFRRIESVSSQ
jgi:hypothetical protein